MSDSMDEAHARDYAAKRKLDDAAHAIAEVVKQGRLSSRAEQILVEARRHLMSASAQIVRAWD